MHKLNRSITTITTMITRRQALGRLGLAASASLLSTAIPASLAQAPALPPPPTTPSGPHKLPPLGYAFDALEPHIDAQTMQIHHGRHHAAYVGNLNRALGEAPDLATKSAEDLVRNLAALPEKIRTAVRNNGGGHVNHSLFWRLLKKNESGQPVGALAQAIEKELGGIAKFKEDFTKAATGVFGSGWAWLSVSDQKKLLIESTPNQDTPLMSGRVPILGLDVWEHAYYLKYQNRRPDYIAAFFKVIDWDFVNAEYKRALG